jgi:hypothetical protein
MIQLESFGSIVPPDPDLNRVYTHGLALDSTDRKTLMVVPFASPRLVQNMFHQYLELHAICDAVKSRRFQ